MSLRNLALGLALAFVASVPGFAQTTCSSLSQTQVLASFADNVPNNSITPRNLRDEFCSTGNALLTPTGSSTQLPLAQWLSYLAGTSPDPNTFTASSFVAGNPTGGGLGAGTVNATGLYVNGVPVSGALVVPNSNLLGGNGTSLQAVTVGSGLGLSAGTLSVTGAQSPSSVVVGSPTGGSLGTGTINATGIYINGVAVAGGLSIPNANLLGGNGSSFVGIATGAGLTLAGGQLSVTTPYNPTLVGITGGTINGTTIGVSSPASGMFTTLQASSTVSGAGFVSLFASPPIIGSGSPSSATFTTLTTTSTGSFQSIVVGSPSGGGEGTGTVNATGLYINGVAVAGGLSVPNASILGGNGSSLTSVSVGTGLTFSAGTLSVTTPYNPTAVAITGGTINGTTLGATTPSSGAFTSISASGAITGASAVIGSPTGGNEGAGTINATGIYVNGVAVAGGLTVPNSSLLGGNGSSLVGVTVGAGLSFGSNTLSITNVYNPASVAITGGTLNGVTIGGSNPQAATFSGLNVAGTSNVQIVNMNGKLSLFNNTTNAPINIPVLSAPPSNLVSGDFYGTTAGLFWRNGAASYGPLGTLASLATTSPIVGGTITGSSGTISCPSCATTGSGGPLSAVVPITISSSGVISLGNLKGAGVVQLPNAVSAGTYYYALRWPWATGLLTQLDYSVSGTGSFVASLQINGTNVAGCNGITINSPAAVTCTGGNSVTQNQAVTVVISSVSGAPTNGVLELEYTRSVP